MNKKDIHELKRRLTKHGCTFTRMCGCYVDAEHNKVTNIAETFLNLEEEDFYKYLDIAKKVFSGTVGNNILELEFPMEEETVGGKQQFLMGLRESELKNNELLDAFYDMVIASYSHPGNYLILLFHDAYDVMKKTKDNMDLDESEEVYDYLICAICPVNLSKPGLGYREEENCIRSRIRDWVVSMPDTGFVFPAFTDRSTDIHSVMFYTRDTKNPHSEFMTEGLGCGARLTATEKKITFESIIKDVIGDGDGKSEILYMDIQDNLNDKVYQNAEMNDPTETNVAPEPMLLTTRDMTEVLTESGLTEEQTAVIEKNYEEVFGEDLPEAGSLVDSKLVEANGRRKDRLELVEQVKNLKQQLEETRALSEEESEDCQVVVTVKPEKEGQIYSQIIDGKKCLIIPLDDDDHALVNKEILF
ncbi:DUF4317 domain-containing protein [bacterium]|nr:DUF4317 domain-containing protein [bacterium]MDY3023240.1 DUF4317 domain-containing protein [Oliverpabstia sp.]